MPWETLGVKGHPTPQNGDGRMWRQQTPSHTLIPAGRLRTAILNPRSFSLSSSPPVSAQHVIRAIPRECTGSKVSARDRAQGRIPAVVFAQQHLTGVEINGRSVSRKQIQAILKSVEPGFFFSITFPLQIRAGSGSSVLLESGTVHPLKVSIDLSFPLRKASSWNWSRTTATAPYKAATHHHRSLPNLRQDPSLPLYDNLQAHL